MSSAAIIGGTIAAAGGITAAVVSSKAAGKGASAQIQASQASQEQQRIMYERYLNMVKPYVSAGNAAVFEMMDLLGVDRPLPQTSAAGAPNRPPPNKNLGKVISRRNDLLQNAAAPNAQIEGPPVEMTVGAERQRRAIAEIENSPLYKGVVRQGEDAMLQGASATGGLRGGNTQRALAEFRPNLLNSLIQQRLGQLGGIANAGLGAATGAGAAGLQTGQGISQSLQSAGAAQAQAALAQANAIRQGIGSISNAVGQITGRFSGSF